MRMQPQSHIAEGFRNARRATEPIVVNILVGGFLAAAFLTNVFDLVRMVLLGTAP